jgi:hypothetical protein
MALPRQFINDAAENVRRDREWIRQSAVLCAGSRHVIQASYALLHDVQRALDQKPGSKPPTDRSDSPPCP